MFKVAIRLFLAGTVTFTSTLTAHAFEVPPAVVTTALPPIQAGTLLLQTADTSLAARGKRNMEDDDDDGYGNENFSAKKAALDGVLNQIERSYGRGSVMRLGQAENMQVETISTGSLTLDAATGGGYPRGRVVEIYGPESSGKTTLALHAIAEVQKRKGGTAAFIDAEHALDPAYAAGCGVNVEDLLVSQPDSGEMALDVVRALDGW